MTAVPPPASFDLHCQPFAQAMRALAQLEPNRDKFIAEAFKRGRGSEWSLDNEAIRPIVLALLHEFFDRPQHSSSELQFHYEQAIRRRNAGGDKPERPTTTYVPGRRAGA